MKNNNQDYSIIDSVQDYLISHNISDKNKILIGFSGGPDSVALVEILSILKLKKQYDIACLYVSHGIRNINEQTKESSFVEKYCLEKSIRLIKKEIEYGRIKTEAYSLNKSLEEIARKYRYSFYMEELENYDYIALGHNLDDQMETMIMRFFQGAGPVGLKGIPEERGNFIRPLYYVEKKKIYEYLEKNHIKYSIDSTNMENDYLRNKVRNKLVPVINDIFPEYKKALLMVKEKIDDINKVISKEIDKIKWIKCSENRYKLERKTFVNMPTCLRIESILGIIKSNDERIPYGFFNNIKGDEKIINGDRILLKGRGIKLFTKGNYIFYETDVVHTIKKSYLYNIDFNKYNNISNLYIIYIKDNLVDNRDFMGIFLNNNGIEKPLIIRSRRVSDKIKTKNGYKTVKKLFSEWKVPEDRKWEIPVIEDRNGIIAVLGKIAGYKNIVSDNNSVFGNKNASLCISFYGDSK